MTAAVVQDAYNYGSGVTGITVNGSSPNPWVAPTDGNLILAGFTNTASPGTPSIDSPAGFELFDAAQVNTLANIRGLVARKIAAAGNTAVVFESTAADNMVASLIEVSGLGADPVLHAIGTPVEANPGLTFDVSITTTVDDCVLFGIVGFVGGQPGASRPTFTGGFTNTGALNRYGAGFYRVAATAGTYTTTVAWTASVTAWARLFAISAAPADGGGGGGGLRTGGRL